MNTGPPYTEKILSKRKFGLVEGEFRGRDTTKLINPAIEVDDYYHWLRDDERKNPSVLKHIDDENTWANKVMYPHEKLTQNLYDEIKSHIVESYDTFASVHNNVLEWKYYRRFKEGQDYHSYWRKLTIKSNNSEETEELEEELLDVNTLAKGKPQCDVSSFDISPSQKLMSWGVDYDGSEKYEFVLVDIETKVQIPTPIPKLAYASYEWVSDTQIYYLVGDDSNRLYQLWLWDMNLPVPICVYEETNPEYDLNAGLTSDEKYLIISSGNYDSNWCGFIEWKTFPTQINNLLPITPNIKYSVESHNNLWYIHTNYNAVNWQVCTINKNSLLIWENLSVFIPHVEQVNISGFGVFENFFVFKTKVNGATFINVCNPERTWIKTLNHTDNKVYSFQDYTQIDYSNYKSNLVYNIGIGPNPLFKCANKLVISYSSLVSPSKLFEYDIETLNWKQIHEQIVPNYNQDLYECKMIWVEQEGTRLGIPVSIVYKKELFTNNNTNPLYLYGYGSYGITVGPDFNYKILPLLDRGFVYAIAHVRGGGFLGYDWYQEGRMNKKINTFKDFIACAEFFANSKMIDPTRIVIEGRSAGGLLIGACISMRPDLFWIGIPGVPFVDVLNTMSDSSIPLTTEEWTQWGNPNELEGYEHMSKYCPYTNIKPNCDYPHLYCTAGLHDPRVPYWEIIKLVAKIRENKTDSNYQIIRVETSQGHFGGSSRYKSIEELAEKYSFILTR